MMGVVLALDWGMKKTGAALGERGFPPQPLPALDSSTRQKLLDEIDKIAKKHRVKEILLGLPPHAKNASKVKEIKGLLEALGYKVVLWEETLTSKKAEAGLVKSGHSKKSVQKNIHSASAALILEEYLNSSFPPNPIHNLDMKADDQKLIP